MNGVILNFLSNNCIYIQVQICFLTHFTVAFFNSAFKSGVCDILPGHRLSEDDLLKKKIN